MTATKPPTIARSYAWAELLRDTFGNSDVSRELADMLGLADERGYLVVEDRTDYGLTMAAPKVGKRAQLEHPHAMDARPKVSTAPEALRNLPPVTPGPVLHVGRKPLAECPSKPARKRHRRHNQSCAICGVVAA